MRLEREKTYSTAYKDGYTQTDYFKQYNMGLTDGIKALNKLPPAQPEQKSGEWIYDGVKRICPFCKDFIVTGRSIVKYCWNCGARLKERSEDDYKNV